jgi:hypothetical protein
MKSNQNEQGPVVRPLIQELIDRQKADFKAQNQTPPQPDLYQDPGGGYNADFVFPQD